MKIYTLHTKQNLPISIETAWEFLSSPKNLKIITPDYMGFKTLSGDEKEMFAGQITQYIVTPVLGIPMKWVTEITHVVDKKYFVDEDDFLKSLDMKSEISEFNKFNIPRIAQLSQRSNQFNLRTIRYTDSDIQNISNDAHGRGVEKMLPQCYKNRRQ